MADIFLGVMVGFVMGEGSEKAGTSFTVGGQQGSSPKHRWNLSSVQLPVFSGQCREDSVLLAEF